MLERSDSAVDRVIVAIKDGIHIGRFVPGQRLIETELTAEFGVSRGSVREALRRLYAEGVVQWERFRGASVLRMSRHQIVELNEIRAALEGFAASLAAVKLDADGRKRLLRLQRRSRPTADYSEYNRDFHQLIWSLSGNRELPQFVESTKLSIIRLQFDCILLAAEHVRRSREDHARIVDAILKRDGKAAERAMRIHIANSTRGILQAPSHFFAPNEAPVSEPEFV